jgi:outer membrane protein assembly factor BamA
MRFNYIRFYENIYKKIKPNLYVGLGINIDEHFSIVDEKLDLTAPTFLPTDHFIYSVLNGFSTTAYTTNGLSFNLIYDARDNAINAYKGSFLQTSFRNNMSWLGSSANSSTLFYDYRKYFNVGTSSTKNILAFWTFGQFLISGKMPYLALPSITWDMYNRSGRGYIQGRFRGENMVYAETEYRFPLIQNGLWGGVLFANITTADNKAQQQKLFNSLAPGYGFGIRLKMNKQTRTNIGMDIGFGSFRSSGIYFNLQEAF